MLVHSDGTLPSCQATRAVVGKADWGRAIITGKDSSYNSVSDLKGTTFGISRLGSGSQVMASVLALQEGWTQAELPKFKGMSRVQCEKRRITR